MIKNLIGGILLNTLILVIIALRIPMGGLTITPISRSVAPLLLGMGAIFYTIYHGAKPILTFLTTPINLLTLGISGVLLNMGAIYLFAFIVNSASFGVTVTLGAVQQTFILSIIIAILALILKKFF